MKVVITGAESSGKTTLFESLEKCYKTKGAKEYARDFLFNTNGLYSQNDLVTIANGQISYELTVNKQHSNLVLCDTDLLTIKIWSEYKYGSCDSRILNLLNKNSADLYRLMSPDIPWQEDPLRENPTNRLELLQIYKKELDLLGIPYFLISGSINERLVKSISLIDKLLLNK